MLLSTGRVLYHWHGGEMTRRAKGLMEIYSQAYVEVNPDDALQLGLNGKNACVSPHAAAASKLKPGSQIASTGTIFANFHFLKPRRMS